ncbi:DUF222 domain-containing protein [Agromyces sp. GXS1127]|uniref:HNH endonuclease signature motif containing protein n=1 Tax=Agromyces sp. GXS1127 TaxID=3424181 RepID=UPI003D3230A6
MPAALADPLESASAAPDPSPYACAQQSLSDLVDAAVTTRRIEAMQAAMRVDVLNLAVDVAMRNAAAFTSVRLDAQGRREMARRAVIAELATALRVPERTMSRLVSEAWTLSTRLPATLDGLRCGRLDESHARVVVDETADLDDPEALARLDAELAARAETVTAATLRRAARRLREQVLAETLAERHASARAERRVELEPARDGMAWLHVYLPAEDAHLIRNRLKRIGLEASGRSGSASRAVAGTDADSGRGTGSTADPDPRTPDQLRADVVRDLLLHGVPPVGDAFHVAAAGIRPTVHVTVPVMTLLGHDDAPGELDGYGPISPEVARELAAHAPSFTRLLTHPVSGTVLDVDRASYRPPADLARWLRVRDETCRFPGCNRAAIGCDLDHSEDWADGNPTAFYNLAHLCAAHHHLKHQTSWSLRHREDGAIEWRSPAGRLHVTEPAMHIPDRRPGTGSTASAMPSMPTQAMPTSAATTPATPTPAPAMPAAPSERRAPTPSRLRPPTPRRPSVNERHGPQRRDAMTARPPTGGAPPF